MDNRQILIEKAAKLLERPNICTYKEAFEFASYKSTFELDRLIKTLSH